MQGWGADGCRGGWVICSYSPSSGASFQLVNSITDFFDKKEFNELLFVDTPIGLSSKGWRQCDLALRDALGKKRASVFMAPVRDAVWGHDYKEACSINQKVTGKKISIQSWNIRTPIKDVDSLLRKKTSIRNSVRESHPEFLFQRLNDGPLNFKKKEKEGIEERLDILSANGCSEKEAVYSFLSQTKRKDVQSDDIVDALMLAFSCYLSLKNGIRVLPENPEIDDLGIEMGIWYPKGAHTSN